MAGEEGTDRNVTTVHCAAVMKCQVRKVLHIKSFRYGKSLPLLRPSAYTCRFLKKSMMK